MNLATATYKLGDLGQVTKHSGVPVSSSINWEKNNYLS